MNTAPYPRSTRSRHLLAYQVEDMVGAWPLIPGAIISLIAILVYWAGSSNDPDTPTNIMSDQSRGIWFMVFECALIATIAYAIFLWRGLVSGPQQFYIPGSSSYYNDTFNGRGMVNTYLAIKNDHLRKEYAKPLLAGFLLDLNEESFHERHQRYEAMKKLKAEDQEIQRSMARARGTDDIKAVEAYLNAKQELKELSNG